MKSIIKMIIFLKKIVAKSLVLTLIGFTFLSCSNSQESEKQKSNLILGFLDYRLGSNIESFPFCKGDAVTEDETCYYCNINYPNTSDIEKDLYRINMRFNKINGLEWIRASYFHDEEFDRIIIRAFPNLDTTYNVAFEKSVIKTKFNKLIYNNDITYGPIEYGKIGNDDINAVWIEAEILDFERWNQEKNNLGEEEMLIIESKQFNRFVKEKKKITSEEALTKKERKSNLFVIYENVNVRAEPNLYGKILFQVDQGSLVEYSGITTLEKTEITLRGTTFNEAWKQIEYKGMKGWIYGATLSESRILPMSNFNIIPEVSFGGISFKSSIADIIPLFAPNDIIIADNDYTDTPTILYPGTKNELHIMWASDKKDEIFRISYWEEGSRWKLESGLKINDSLQDIKEVNEKDFMIVGPNPDFNTHTYSWNGGVLNEKIILVLESEFRKNYEEYMYLKWNKEYLSSDSDILKSELFIDGIIILN